MEHAQVLLGIRLFIFVVLHHQDPGHLSGDLQGHPQPDPGRRADRFDLAATLQLEVLFLIHQLGLAAATHVIGQATLHLPGLDVIAVVVLVDKIGKRVGIGFRMVQGQEKISRIGDRRKFFTDDGQQLAQVLGQRHRLEDLQQERVEFFCRGVADFFFMCNQCFCLMPGLHPITRSDYTLFNKNAIENRKRFRGRPGREAAFTCPGFYATPGPGGLRPRRFHDRQTLSRRAGRGSHHDRCRSRDHSLAAGQRFAGSQFLPALVRSPARRPFPLPQPRHRSTRSTFWKARGGSMPRAGSTPSAPAASPWSNPTKSTSSRTRATRYSSSSAWYQRKNKRTRFVWQVKIPKGDSHTALVSGNYRTF